MAKQPIWSRIQSRKKGVTAVRKAESPRVSYKKMSQPFVDIDMWICIPYAPFMYGIFKYIYHTNQPNLGKSKYIPILWILWEYSQYSMASVSLRWTCNLAAKQFKTTLLFVAFRPPQHAEQPVLLLLQQHKSMPHSPGSAKNQQTWQFQTPGKFRSH